MTKIVLIEDDEMLRKSLSFFLKANDYNVKDFNNGLDALNFITENPESIALIITDLNLPFVGGKELVHTCKSKELGMKVIVLTSLSVETTELELFDLGADEFIAKPFSPQVLLKRIQKMLA